MIAPDKDIVGDFTLARAAERREEHPAILFGGSQPPVAVHRGKDQHIGNNRVIAEFPVLNGGGYRPAVGEHAARDCRVIPDAYRILVRVAAIAKSILKNA